MDVGEVLRMLNITPAVVVNMVGFALLFWLLRYLYYGPIGRFLDEREAEIRESREEAARTRREAQEEKERLQEELGRIEETARDRIQQATREAAKARDEIVAGARTEAEDLVARGKEQLEREKEKALVEIKDHAAEIAVDACEAILRRTLTDDRHRVLVDEFLRDLESFRATPPSS